MTYPSLGKNFSLAFFRMLFQFLDRGVEITPLTILCFSWLQNYFSCNFLIIKSHISSSLSKTFMSLASAPTSLLTKKQFNHVFDGQDSNFIKWLPFYLKKTNPHCHVNGSTKLKNSFPFLILQSTITTFMLVLTMFCTTQNVRTDVSGYDNFLLELASSNDETHINDISDYHLHRTEVYTLRWLN